MKGLASSISFKDLLMERARRFTVMDYVVFKSALVLFGIVVGAYISGLVMKYVLYVVAAFLMLYAYLLYRMLKK